jgi:hypothetical protein
LGSDVKVKVQLTSKTLYGTLNSFNYEPCKIGYEYGKNIILSGWYLHGGLMNEPHQNEAHFQNLREKYKYKGITEDMKRIIISDTFYNLVRI